MRNLAVRVALAGLFVVACGVAAYLLWANESRARRESQSFRTFEAAAITGAAVKKGETLTKAKDGEKKKKN